MSFLDLTALTGYKGVRSYELKFLRLLRLPLRF